jgi:hypothetical protein
LSIPQADVHSCKPYEGLLLNNITSGSEKEILADFFCKMLKFKTEERANFVELSKHRFFKTKFGG